LDKRARRHRNYWARLIAAAFTIAFHREVRAT
jgi:hypothetical protein